jgi:phage terminase small subunit
MGKMTPRQKIVKALIAKGATKDRATMYADAFLEYTEATANIEENGTIVQHPRTANPIENPYLAIRDRAARKLAAMRKLKADFLW